MVARLLATLGYRRTKPTIFARERPYTVEFINIHKFTYRPSFRVHVAIRVLNDETDYIVLNGPNSDPYRPAERPNDKSYDLSFDVDEPSLENCARNVFEFVRDIGEPWLLCWHNPHALINQSESPINDQAKQKLVEAVEGKSNPTNVEISRKLFALA
jgi:hypothetical protein